MSVHRLSAPAWIPLRCGPVEMEFAPTEGWLRRLRVSGPEVLRAIYGAVRDRNWVTVPPRLHGLCIDREERSFQVTFDVECVAAGIAFAWQCEIFGEEDGALTFRFAGEARAAFWRNRIGLCVLHPVEGCAGRRCLIETVDGAMLDASFPQFIAPHQPFKNIRALTYEALPGVQVEVRFAGEIFETEDQRNWTDASFKTYSTPLAEPFPVWIERGTRVEQTVTVRVTGALSNVSTGPSDSDCPELFATGAAARSLPPIGLGMASHGAALTAEEAARLRLLRPAHLRVDLHLRDPAWRAEWRRAARDAAAVGATLHVAAFLSDNAERELAALAAEHAASQHPVSLWLIFHENESSTHARWVRLARAALPAGAAIAAGTNANFAEINRARPTPIDLALPCYSLNPQGHAFDDASLIENLGAQADTVESARQFAAEPIVISPITLRPRFSAVATGGESLNEEALPPQVDVRQMSLFGAAWTVGSLARLAALEGVHSLTYYETTGWRGLMETATGSPRPALFPSSPGGIFPMYHVFAALAVGERILPTQSTHPLRFDGFCLFAPDGRRHWVVANLTGVLQTVRVKIDTESAMVCILDETNATVAVYTPDALAQGTPRAAPGGSLELVLNACAVAKIVVG